jgi:hypothetical protein
MGYNVGVNMKSLYSCAHALALMTALSLNAHAATVTLTGSTQLAGTYTTAQIAAQANADNTIIMVG